MPILQRKTNRLGWAFVCPSIPKAYGGQTIMDRRSHRQSKPHDVRRFAEAAHADTASIATSLALLLEPEPSILLDPTERKMIQAGIKSKCITAIANLQIIANVMGGDR